jgi:type III secretory pathway component EscU
MFQLVMARTGSSARAFVLAHMNPKKNQIAYPVEKFIGLFSARIMFELFNTLFGMFV